MNDFKQAAHLASTVGHRMSAWIAEIEELKFAATLLPLTSKQTNRLCDLNSSLDCYEDALTHGFTELPKEPWITRALKAVN